MASIPGLGGPGFRRANESGTPVWNTTPEHLSRRPAIRVHGVSVPTSGEGLTLRQIIVC